MNHWSRFTALLLLTAASLPASALQPTAVTSQTVGQCPPLPVVPPAGASQQAFDQYSWQLFITLNWPALAGQRGVADCSKTLGSPGDTVWQSYKGVNEVFLPQGQDPGPWNSPPMAKVLKLINIAGRKNTATANDNQAVGGWLIDQNGNPTYYQIAANQVSYDYIVNNQFYNADVVAKASNINFPNATNEIKSSWRILTSKDDPSRYLHMQAQITTFDAQGVANGTAQATLGLVGLHIVNKVEGFPQWIWSTFEQVDNVPPKVKQGDQWVNQPQPGIAYSYFDAKAPADKVNQSPCNWTLNNGHMTCTPKPGMSFTTPNPLDRFTPLTDATTKLNSEYQALPQVQASVFKYYQLITTQWSTTPNPGAPMGQTTPELSANVTMESYIQPNSSCTNCHSMATPINSLQKADFSYLFKFAQSPSSPATKGKE
ncbi:hypothetical protein H7A76_09070 [Pseudomonas sp. MSSRFD41]|uniref:hypothetical protein n=1 Tax=unclassified Pseudomonas TaxID=196821 RepID=UPI0016399C07|nr:hypothetical protein [Pseudomonas sp. MSSRFD41]MBC2655585.1 hypothetical protein [Pseudomonas sp. MSSRFD41]